MFACHAPAAQPSARPDPAPRNVPRVISFSPAITTIIHELGLDDRLVGVTTHCPPVPGRDLPRVGDQFNFSLQQILQLRPDLLLTQSSQEHFRSLEKIAPHIRVVNLQIETLEDIPETAAEIAKLLADSTKLPAAVTEFKTVLRTSRARARQAAPDVRTGRAPRVLFLMGTDRPTAAASGTFLHDMIRLTGAVNAGDELPGRPVWRETTLQAIHDVRPDVLLCQEYNPARQDATREYWMQWNDLPAVRQDRVHILTDPSWTIPSLQLAEKLPRLFEMIHGTPATSQPAGPHDAQSRPAPTTHPHTQSDALRRAELLRMLAVALCGAVLACGGATLQGILRNPLAEPYLLGLSSGAGVGVLLGLAAVGQFGVWGWATMPALAFLGAILAAVVVFGIAQRGGSLDPYSTILAGVIVNAFNAAVMLAIHLYIDPYRIPDFTRWSMGQVPELVEPTALALGAALAAAALLVMLWRARWLDALSLGDDVAFTSGVSVGRLRAELFLAVSLATAVSVGLIGPIGFVGLIVPHMVRLVLGPRHTRLLPVCLLGGALFLLGADAVGRWLGPRLDVGKVPVGVLCAFCGAPFFLLLLRRGRMDQGGRG
jgi:iron complex transport system permease protein